MKRNKWHTVRAFFALTVGSVSAACTRSTTLSRAYQGERRGTHGVRDGVVRGGEDSEGRAACLCKAAWVGLVTLAQ